MIFLFQPLISAELEKYIQKNSKNKELINVLKNKIKEICLSDKQTINHYKNLRNDMSNYKRVHIMKSFVLLFRPIFEENKIYFYKFDHHDNIYK